MCICLQCTSCVQSHIGRSASIFWHVRTFRSLLPARRHRLILLRTLSGCYRQRKLKPEKYKIFFLFNCAQIPLYYCESHVDILVHILLKLVDFDFLCAYWYFYTFVKYRVFTHFIIVLISFMKLNTGNKLPSKIYRF